MWSLGKIKDIVNHSPPIPIKFIFLTVQKNTKTSVRKMPFSTLTYPVGRVGRYVHEFCLNIFYT